jgi:hypothetical protein
LAVVDEGDVRDQLGVEHGVDGGAVVAGAARLPPDPGPAAGRGGKSLHAYRVSSTTGLVRRSSRVRLDEAR